MGYPLAAAISLGYELTGSSLLEDTASLCLVAKQLYSHYFRTLYTSSSNMSDRI